MSIHKLRAQFDDVLPRVTIRTDVEARTFLTRLRELPKSAWVNAKLNHNDGRVAGEDILSIMSADSHSRPKLVGDLVADNPTGIMVRVEVRGACPPGVVSYDRYVGAVRELVAPALRAYNKAYSSRRQLHIPTKRSLAPRLPKGARSVFEHFVSRANRAGLHDFDWSRFYSFIWHCSLRRVHCDEIAVRRLLTLAGFGDEMARDIANVYYHGREIANGRPRY